MRIDEKCPDCRGDLQRQDERNLFCLDCESTFGHYRPRTGVQILLNEQGQVAARLEPEEK